MPGRRRDRSDSAVLENNEIQEEGNVMTDVAVDENDVTGNPEVSEDSVVENTEDANRIPDVLASNPIFTEFCNRYLAAFDEITEYNKIVLAERDSEWNSSKVLAKARELGNPDSGDADTDIKPVFDEYEAALTAFNKAKKSLIEKTAEKLGIKMSAVADRDPATEGPLKEKRKLATEIGTQLTSIAGMTQDKATSEAVTEFFAKFPMPAIGRDSVRTFGEGSGSTPKYRVLVSVKNKDGQYLLQDEKGFSKTALKLTQPVFGYERGKALKSDKLREAWEGAGNTAEKTTVNPVVFEDNELTYEIRKPD